MLMQHQLEQADLAQQEAVMNQQASVLSVNSSGTTTRLSQHASTPPFDRYNTPETSLYDARFVCFTHVGITICFCS